MNGTGSWRRAVIWWILPIALSSAIVAQQLHEAVHAATALLLGARVDLLGFYVVESSWPAGAVHTELKDGFIAGSAAVANMLLAFACMALFRRLERPAGLRLLVFYLGAYSLFLGFGYLFIDAIRASPEALGDWAHVVMLLGGGWPVRLAVGGVGGLGTVWGYFWMGRAAQHFTLGDPQQRRDQIRLGMAVCLIPYPAVNAVLTALAVWHGSTGSLFAIFAYWGSYIGFFWAFMIKFVWSKYEGPLPPVTPLPTSRSPWPLLAAIALLAFTAAVMASGIS